MPRLEDHLCFAVYAANHAFTAAYRPWLEALGLTYPQYLVLLLLWERDAQAVKEIGARLYLDSGTLTPLLKRMEANGLVTRRRDAADERVVRIALTAKGQALRAEGAALWDRMGCMLGGEATALGALRTEVTELAARLREGVRTGG